MFPWERQWLEGQGLIIPHSSHKHTFFKHPLFAHNFQALGNIQRIQGANIRQLIGFFLTENSNWCQLVHVFQEEQTGQQKDRECTQTVVNCNIHFLKINVILNSSSLENHTDKHAKCFQNVSLKQLQLKPQNVELNWNMNSAITKCYHQCMMLHTICRFHWTQIRMHQLWWEIQYDLKIKIDDRVLSKQP